MLDLVRPARWRRSRSRRDRLEQAGKALDDLRAGKIVGRVVITP